MCEFAGMLAVLFLISSQKIHWNFYAGHGISQVLSEMEGGGGGRSQLNAKGTLSWSEI